MKSFAGFEDFVPIFQGGKQTDSQGNEHDGDELIDKAVESFSPEYHEPPVVVGHPKDNSPAFGWVESVKKVAKKLKDGTTISVLMAKFKDVVPEFASAVQQGLFKKRSASFYPDGRLRHVGFLGGMPPAVKGLADLKFSADDKAIEFEEPLNFMVGGWGMDRVASLFRNLRDFFIEKFSLEDADKVIPSYNIDDIHDEAGRMSLAELPQTAGEPLYSEGGINMPKTFTEEELQAQLKAEKDRLTAEFAEKEKKATEAIEAAKTQDANLAKMLDEARRAGEEKASALFAEQRRKDNEAAKKREVAELISSSVKTGKILPAWAKMGLARFMESLSSETAIEFGEGESKATKTPYEFFKCLMAELPKTVSFGEFASRDKNVGGAGSAGAQLESLTRAKMEAKNIDYMTAFNEVQIQNRQLVAEYEQEMKAAR
jgi:hypothetical protein